METFYYIVVDGKQAGPFPKKDLAYSGLTRDTYVWREGLDGWIKASDLPELDEVFAPAAAPGQPCQQPYQQPYQQPQAPQPYQEPYQQQPYQQAQQPYQQQPYQQPYQQQAYQQPAPQPYQQPYQQPAYGDMKPRTNWLTWAIIATVLGLCSCLGMIFGIIGIVNANKANSAYAMGDEATGDSSNSTARTMTIIALILDGLGIIGSIVYYALIIPQMTNDINMLYGL